jgi:hypothetical protein
MGGVVRGRVDMVDGGRAVGIHYIHFAIFTRKFNIFTRKK